MKAEVIVDEIDNQFVVNSGNSTICLRFDTIFSQAVELERRLGLPKMVKSTEIGTIAQYEQHGELLQRYALLDDKETWFDNTTPPAVRQVLERYRRMGGTVRIYMGDRLTGRDWLTEFDSIGKVSRSPGPMRIPKLVPTGQADGGSIITSAVVRVQDMDSGLDVYKHPNYHLPKMTLLEVRDPSRLARGISHEILIQGVDKASTSTVEHSSIAVAAHWLAFMYGRVHNLHEAEI